MICNLCKNEIDTKKERYVHVEDFDRGKFVKDLWAHLPCFNRAMNKDLTELEKQAKVMLSQAGRVFESDSFKELFPKKEEEYIIK